MQPRPRHRLSCRHRHRKLSQEMEHPFVCPDMEQETGCVSVTVRSLGAAPAMIAAGSTSASSRPVLATVGHVADVEAVLEEMRPWLHHTKSGIGANALSTTVRVTAR